MVELTEIQTNIQNSLTQVIWNGNLLEVQNIFKDNEDSNIQKILRHVWTSNGLRNTVLRVAIDSYNIQGQKEAIEIIELIWQRADQKTRDFLCSIEYDLAKDGSALETVIEEIEEHKRVMDLGYELRGAIKELDVERVKELLENCGEDVESVLEREVYWTNGGVDTLLVFPLLVNYDRELNQEDVEKIKESFKLMFDAASPGLLGFEPNRNNYVMDTLTCAQKSFAKIPGVGEQCFQDLIQEFEENLSRDTLDNAKTDDQIAWDKAYATRFSQEINHDLFENDELNAFMDDTDLGQDTENSAPTTGNKTPEKNETTFWNEHKGKIALGVTGLCVAGAVAAYMLAYPAVALALTVLAAVILMGAGIAKVLEDPSVEKPFTQQQEVNVNNVIPARRAGTLEQRI